MEFECQLSEAEMREAVDLNRAANGRMGWVLRNLRVLAILAVAAVIAVANLTGGSHNWGAVVALVCAGAALVAVSVWSERFGIRRMAKRINGACVRMTVDANGIGAADALGRTIFAPWSQFRGWREGRLVFTVGDAKAFRTIPKSAMNEMQVGEARGILQTQIRQ